MQLQENLVVADRFRLVRMIGRGGMGSVWQAVHISLDQPCAVKFIEGELANVADAHARFEREAKAAAQLRSPHVVQILDHGVWQGRPYIAMELLEGEDLGKTLARSGGKLPAMQMYPIIQQVCRALTKAHQAGIVHRDLKPDNIFLVNDDDRQLVKILDFGVAKQTSQAIDGSNTKTGAMLGTPYYMSPEQAQGIKSVDSRSDLWSLAVIVYQCITGRLPFESEALGDLLVKIIVHPVPVPSQIAHVPPGFDKWWAKAAERNPDNRFTNAKEFSASLGLALGASSVTDPGTRTPQQLQGTAMMVNAPQTAVNAPPQFVPAQTAALQTTPHPANHPSQNTPQGMVMGGPPPNTPPPGQQHYAHASSQNMSGGGAAANSHLASSFSGVEPPAMIPKKGPPVAILAALGVFLVLGAVGTGLLVTRNKGGTTAGSSSSSSGSAPTTTTTSSVATNTPPASETAPVPPPPTATETAAAPSASVAAAPTTTTTAAPTGTGKSGVKTQPTAPTTVAKTQPTAPTPTQTPTAAPTPTTTATAAASSKKWTPGF